MPGSCTGSRAGLDLDTRLGRQAGPCRCGPGCAASDQPNLEGYVRGDVPTGATLGVVCQTADGDQVNGRVAYDQNNRPTSIPFKTWESAR
jgi:hypothetical protein